MRMKSWLKVAVGAALSLVTSSVMAQAPAPELKAGDMAPAFSLPGSDGKTHTLAEHKASGRWCWRGFRRPLPVVERQSASRSVRAAI
jgi:hypothetical protein